MTELVRTWGGRARALLERSATRRQLASLERDNEGTTSTLLRAIGAVTRGEVSVSERVWIARIERVRAEMNASTVSISNVDYGAQVPGRALSAEAMNEGRVVTRTLGELSRASSKPPRWALLLLKMIRELRPAVCVELGTCVGLSAAYQAAALELNQRGKLVTLEGAPPLAAIARQNLARLGLRRATVVTGRFKDTLPGVLLDHGPVDLAFVDGHHDERATLEYLEALHPHLAPGATLVFDDIHWSPGMTRAWAAIAADPRHALSLDLHQLGVCAVGARREGPRIVRLRLG